MSAFGLDCVKTPPTVVDAQPRTIADKVAFLLLLKSIPVFCRPLSVVVMSEIARIATRFSVVAYGFVGLCEVSEGALIVT
jgi:hypothetical protein